MWVISTDRAELQSFPTPESVPGGYAILSHVWDDREQSFQDIEVLRVRCSREGSNPRDFASAKIQTCCILAESHGYRWVWIDTCCIDKTSSAELSEAINSMFHYYSLAAVCYAYLRDVPASSRGRYGRDSAFGNSRWHTRGWTLQELVAPSVVLFLSSEWEVLGSKMDMALDLQIITGIPKVVLRMQLGQEAVSVAQRMCWASTRQTTRPEDEAYCLMGLFGISMPTLYGEGREAFRRLQQEIMKQTVDTSLFAWGPFMNAEDAPAAIAAWRPDCEHGLDNGYLLATSPAAFKYSGNIRFRPSLCDHPPTHPDLDRAQMPESYTIPRRLELLGIPTFSTTSYGVLAEIPILEADGFMIAVLFCDAVLSDNLSNRVIPIGLLLNTCAVSMDPDRLLFHTSMTTYRIVDVLPYLLRLSDGQGVTVKREGVYLAHFRRTTPPRAHLLSNISVITPFRIPQLHLNELSGLGLEVRMPALDPWWRGSPAASVFFIPTRDCTIPAFAVYLGRCDNTPSGQSSFRPQPGRHGYGHGSSPLRYEAHANVPFSSVSGPHWASVVSEGHLPLYPDQPLPHIQHRCPEDHIERWVGRTRLFPILGSHKRARVQAWFTPCQLYPDSTLIVHLSFFQDSDPPTGTYHDPYEPYNPYQYPNSHHPGYPPQNQTRQPSQAPSSAPVQPSVENASATRGLPP